MSALLRKPGGFEGFLASGKHLQASANVGGFQAALHRIEPSWVAHLTFREVGRTG